jgi:hypothetical protein
MMEGLGKLLNVKGTFECIKEMVKVTGIREAVSLSMRERLKTNRVGELYKKEVVEQLVRQHLDKEQKRLVIWY